MSIIVCCYWCLLLCHWDSYNCLIESAVLMINDLMLIRHYIRLSVAVRRDWYHQIWTLFVCLFLHCRPTWGYGPLIACRPSLFMLTLSVSFVPCMLSYSIFWSQTSNKLTYLLNVRNSTMYTSTMTTTSVCSNTNSSNFDAVCSEQYIPFP